MKTADLIVWFDSLCEQARRLDTDKNHNVDYLNDKLLRDFHAWHSEATMALISVFPVPHHVRYKWRLVDFTEIQFPTFRILRQLVGTFSTAASVIRSGRLSALIDTIRAQAEAELLDQAESLLEKYPAAGAVIAGGALETHLRHLASKNGLQVGGKGSIEAYNMAIAQARNSGNEIYSATLGKQVTAWGSIRNEAAHDPGNFPHPEADLKRMIDGIRDFIERTTSDT